MRKMMNKVAGNMKVTVAKAAMLLRIRREKTMWIPQLRF